MPVAVTVHPVPPRDSPYGRSWARVRRAVLARDGYRCHICGGPGADSVDHLDPVSTHGPRIPPLDRLAAAHVGCNSRRARLLEQERRAASPSHPARPQVVTGPPGQAGVVGRDPARRPGAWRMTPVPEEPWEARVARAAARRDLKVQRSHDWNPSLPDDGTYVLVNLWTNGAVAGPGLSREGVERALEVD